ncbi:MAG TPA: hypothetical protein VNU97_03720 [Rhizomicrobium sp.]|nr:hypothetical protein [Rhizomicrobium sp.]
MKIPFERTIAGAYRFAFTNILSILGIGWFPFLLFAALVTGLVFALLPLFHGLWLADAKRFDQARLVGAALPLIGSFFLVIVAWMFVAAMVNVGIMRKALGLHPAPVFIFFSLGPQVWQMIGSYLLLMLLAWGAVALWGLGIGAVALLLGQVWQAGRGAIVGLLIFIACLWFYYAAIRISFFIPAVVVAENHIGLRRSWHLGRGNFWRILGILLIVSVPVGMAVSTITSSMMQMSMGPGFGITPGMTPADSQKVLMDMFVAMRKIAPYYAGLQLLYVIVISGLTAGAAANAYKFVTGASEPDPAKAAA